MLAVGLYGRAVHLEVLGAMTVYLDKETAFPGFEPDEEDEVVVDRDEAFIAYCQARHADREWSYGNSISTRSKRWGRVWRVEISGPLHPDLIHRFVCWGSTEGIDGTAFSAGGEPPW